MVSCCWKTLRQSFEQSLAVMENFTRLSMHQRWRADDPSSKYLANGLMAETDSQDRDGFVKMPDDVFCDSRIGGRTRAGRNNDARGFQPLDFFRRNLIVSEYPKVFPKLTQILYEVVRKRIVIIDNHNHIFKSRYG